MAESPPYTGQIYRLRASAPMPISGGRLVLHTFGGELSDIELYECTLSLPRSNEFRGQGLGGNLVSASYSRLGDLEGHFQGRKQYAPAYIDERDIF